MDTPNEQAYIPFQRPSFEGNELEHITTAMDAMRISGDGIFSKKSESLLAGELRAARVMMTPSCTAALEMAAILSNASKECEVLVPSFSFVSTANAFFMRGAKPIFVDVKPDTLNIDPEDLKRKITEKSRIVVAVHYAGFGCEMDELLSIAKRFELSVIEDNSHGLFGSYRGTPLGTLGRMSALNFDESTPFSCGNAGALVLNDESLIDRAEVIRAKGTNRKKFLDGAVDKYTWVDIGSNYLPSEIQTAFLYAQLEEKDSILSRRKEVWNSYYSLLEGWCAEKGIQLPCISQEVEQSYHMFFMLMPDAASREGLVDHLSHNGIQAVPHYSPLHLSPMGRLLGGNEGDCPVSESVSARLIRLPFYNTLDRGTVETVVASIKEFQG